MKYIIALFILLVLISCSNRVTQNINTETASLDGYIIPENASADTLQFTISAILADNDTITYTTSADENGYFIIKKMKPGNYNVLVSSNSFYYLSKSLTTSLFIDKKTSLGEIHLSRIEPNSSLEGYIVAENIPVQNTIIEISYKIETDQYIVAKTISADSTGYYKATNLFPRDVKIVYSLENFDPITKYISLHENQITTLDTVYFELINEIPQKTISIDGVIDSDWQPLYQNNHTSNWSSSNDFSAFYVAFSPDTLYIAVTGGFDNSGNCVNIYIDKDYKEETGINDFSQISGGSIGNHLRKNIVVDDNFGADLAFSEWALSSDIKLVSLSDAENVNQNELNFNYSINTSVMEIAIPIYELYENGEIPSAQKLAIVAIIGGGGDQYFADDTIPQQENAAHFSSVLKMKFPQ